jgi:hypothetical protein
MEANLGVAAYLGLGLLLVSANVWYVQTIVRTFQRPAMPQLIQPFQVIGKADESGKLGLALAHLLQGSLGRIRGEAYRSLEQVTRTVDSPTEAILTDGITLPTKPDDPISLPSEVFAPLTLTMNVAGVEVGSLVSWLRSCSSKAMRCGSPSTIETSAQLYRRPLRRPTAIQSGSRTRRRRRWCVGQSDCLRAGPARLRSASPRSVGVDGAAVPELHQVPERACAARQAGSTHRRAGGGVRADPREPRGSGDGRPALAPAATGDE